MSSYRLLLIFVFLFALSLEDLFSQSPDNAKINDQLFFLNNNTYSSSISFGYIRTNDNRRFYPEKGKGAYYFSGSLEHDRAKNIKLKGMILDCADYISYDFSLAYDWGIQENYFNIDLLIFGKNKFESSGSKSRRTMYGFFNGLEFFRPGWGNRSLTWDQPVYKNHAHVQYTIWRMAQWSTINTFASDAWQIKMQFSAGAGPSINSSLNAVNITPAQEDQLSHIFKCQRYRKENYYYGIALPLSAGFSADTAGFRFGVNYNFYFFRPIENERAYDILNIFKFSLSRYLTESSRVNIQYEYRRIHSMLRNVYKDHGWNTIIMDIKFCF